MESAGENVTAIEVPGEDAAIGLALDDLDTKIEAFSTAMQAGLGALRSAADRAWQDQRSKADSSATADIPNAPAGEPAPAAVKPAAKAIKTEATEEPAKPIPVVRAAEKPAGPQVVKFRPNAASEPEPARPAEVDEDEALLATLDPKVAKAIRIKRRLCNNKKSVRELLDEQQRR